MAQAWAEEPDPLVLVYPLCEACDCGCEPDGDWHWDGSAGCMCAARGCPCVVDRRGAGVGGEVVEWRGT